MKITYSEALRQSSDLFALVQQATQHLEELVGRYLLPIAAKWDLGSDKRGRPIVVLRLWDRVEKSTTHFSEAELKDAETVERRLSEFWGDWLEANSQKRMEALYKAINETIGFEDAGQDPQ